MLSLDKDKLQGLLQQSDNIRNVSIIGNTGHGKTTLVNLLAREVGVVPLAETKIVPLALDLREQKNDCPSEQLTNTALFVQRSENVDPKATSIETNDFLINLIDSPGHSALANEVTPAIRISDGSLVVVNCLQDLDMHTEALLRIVLNERVKPVILFNKVDRAFLESQATDEDIYQSFARTIRSINDTIGTHASDALGDMQLHPPQGTVAFGSCRDGWAFTIRTFSTRYAKKFGVDEEKMSRRLWGDHYFIAGEKKWSSKTDGTERAFNTFILSIYRKLVDAFTKGEKNDLSVLAAKLEIDLSQDERQKNGKDLFQIMMQKFMPATKTLTEMMVLHLPSPSAAQKYRAEFLYEGPPTDFAYDAIRDCDPKANVMLFVCNMITMSDDNGQRYYALARVFAGTVHPNDKLNIYHQHYRYGRPTKSFVKKIGETAIILGQAAEPVRSVPAGNIIGITGVDQFLLRSGTITSNENAYNIRMMRPATSPVVKCHVDVENPADLPKLLEGLKHIARFGPSVQLNMDETGDHSIAGPGEHHLAISLKELQRYTDVPLKVPASTTQYRETISRESVMTALSKTPNRHSRFYVTAEPLGNAVTKAIESGEIRSNDQFENRAKILIDKYNWDVDGARRIWAFGHEESSISNVLVNQTKRAQYLNEIKDSFISGFIWATRLGPIAEEPMSSIRFNILDVVSFCDVIHRGAGQVIPAARRVICAATMLSEPRLLEPVYHLEIRIPQQDTVYDAIHGILTQRRGRVLETVRLNYSASMVVKAYLPVMESFGFEVALQGVTESKASSISIFDHWQTLPESPLDQTTGAGRIAADLRRAKGLKEQVPTYEFYYDKL